MLFQHQVFKFLGGVRYIQTNPNHIEMADQNSGVAELEGVF